MTYLKEASAPKRRRDSRGVCIRLSDADIHDRLGINDTDDVCAQYIPRQEEKYGLIDFIYAVNCMASHHLLHMYLFIYYG